MNTDAAVSQRVFIYCRVSS